MTRFAMPDPPPADVTTLWDAHGNEWHRRPGIGDRWCHGLMALDWQSLVHGHGPLSDTPPEGDTMTLAEAELADLRAQQTTAAGGLSPVQEARLALMVAAIRSGTGHRLAEISRYLAEISRCARWVMTGEADGE